MKQFKANVAVESSRDTASLVALGHVILVLGRELPNLISEVNIFMEGHHIKRLGFYSPAL